ncbi:MAG: heat-inducible transcription repressor HrcA [Actinobacteria bacterium]|nr:heat-inducible transcription repressor HrcA [Actinomycetota bacterium]MBM3816382.1 heat-inducible transcription repressor HrcA [Actinomycetota bacterium]
MPTSGVDDRKIAVLRAVIEHYVSTGQPVGSSHVAAMPGITVSAATIRNDMVALETEGYLVQPHTSAGRVPTDKGYRMYVDHLTSSDVAQAGRLNAISRQRLGDFFDTAHFRLEETLHRTSLLLAQLTNYTAVVTGPSVSEAVVRSAQVVVLSDRIGTVVAVLSNGEIESEQIEFATRPSELQLALANSRINESLVGATLSAAKFTAVTGVGVDSDVEALVAKAVASLAGGRGRDSVFVGGTASLTTSFDAVEVVRSVLETLEQQYVVVSLVRDMLSRGVSVAIGSETGVEPLSVCSVVLAPVVRDGETVGSVGVLGPTRMNYPAALATVEVVSDRLGRRLTEG